MFLKIHKTFKNSYSMLWTYYWYVLVVYVFILADTLKKYCPFIGSRMEIINLAQTVTFYENVIHN